MTVLPRGGRGGLGGKVLPQDRGGLGGASPRGNTLFTPAPGAAPLARMIAAGEDPRFIARRMIICAAEDVGLADPMALLVGEFHQQHRIGN